MNTTPDGATNSVLTSGDWQLGTPNNSLATAAHSGTHCWGTNLRGDANDYADSSLVSPAIQLTGGNVATLTFWHNYNFIPVSDADLLETGGVYISTNNGNAWIPLTSYDQSSTGWEQATVDLSAYLGQVVRLGWAYALFSTGTDVHPGWLVDDVAVTVTNLIRGTIIVSNNLAEAAFHLRGPAQLDGAGWTQAFPSAPPGTYTLTFDPVPYYLTPPSQTNTLTGTNTLTFQAQYTFVDANHNGIPDAWELRYFGAVATNHPPTLDSDADGFSDYAEFIAGTNPTNAASYLFLWPPTLEPNRTVRLDWPSVPGRAYRAHLSTNLVDWPAASAWLIATNTNSSLTLPPLINSPFYGFRLEVRP